MDLVRHLHQLGGVATRTALVRATSRAAFDRAFANGDMVRDAHGRYALPVAEAALRSANALTGVVSHRSAALHKGWQVKVVPPFPDVTVRRNRTIDAERRAGIALHWANLSPDEIDGNVTARDQTLIDCMRALPFDEALAIADSAQRNRSVTQGHLVALAQTVRGPGAPQARRVARESTHLAANPFESVLRAIALDVPGLDLRPQVVISDRQGRGRPDLVDWTHRWVVEAESYSWHSKPAALRRDCRRYTKLVLLGWRVLRFAWVDVMHHQDYVRECLMEAASIAAQRAGSEAAGDVAA